MRYGLIGEKLPHSFSGVIHKKIGLYDYELLELERDELDAFMTARDFEGINVTIPYKRDVMKYMHKISDGALKAGAVNVVVNRGGMLYGYNTDFEGMRGMILGMGFSFAGRKVVILGTGGTSHTARAVAEGLGAGEIVIVSREAREGAVKFDGSFAHYDADFLINTTPAGMYPNVEDVPYGMALERFTRLEGVIDAIYNPLRTNLVSRAGMLGIRAVGGLYMLVSQAVLAAEYFTGKELGSAVCDRIYREISAEKASVVLTGMPGCGKSTVGKILAERLGRTFYDSDEEFEKKYGATADYIRENGEAAFRERESEIIKELSRNNEPCVISTGGGAVLRAENVNRLRRNGRLYYLDRDIELITPTDTRPLSSDREALRERHEERRAIYEGTCDKIIENNGCAMSAADKIAEDFFT